MNSEQLALNIIRQAYAKLMKRQYFYFNIANQFALKATPKDKCPTMGVAHVDGVHWLVYNPDFIKYYDFKEISVILEHEICHFTYDHVKHFESAKHSTRRVFKDEAEATDAVRKNEEEKYIHKTKNIATDRSINVYLFDLPNIRMSWADLKEDFTDEKGVLDINEFNTKVTELMAKGKLWFKDPAITQATAVDSTILESQCITETKFKSILEEAGYEGDINQVARYEGWKYYFDMLMSCPKTEEAIKDIKEMDVHFGDEEDENGAQAGRDRVMMEAARNSNKHDIPGDLRAHIKELFDKYSKEAPLPWYTILRRLVNSSKKSILSNDINTRNRYYGNNKQIIPGYKTNPIKDIAVIWDVSGSCMDDETQIRFISECNAMIKSGSNVRVYYTDSDVENIQDCKDKMMPPGQYEITGGGGTDLSKGISRAISDGYRIIIQLTDCYMDWPLSKRDLKGRKVITVSTTEAKPPTHYGPVIHVTNN